jgi:SAM-dependent methyltransferase
LSIVRLDLGGGPKRPGAFKLDRTPSHDTDVLATLEGGLPFRDDSIDEVFAGYSLEHAADFVGALEDLWRASKPGALIHIHLPHATSPWAGSRDPRHQRQYTIETFEYFDPGRRDPQCSSAASFEIEQARLYLTSRRGGGRGRGIARGTVSRIFETLANRNRGMQYRWERWLGNVIGFEEFYVLLTVVKAGA